MNKLDKLSLAILALNRVNAAKGDAQEHVVAMAAVWGALRQYAKQYGIKMHDLHKWDKRLRKGPKWLNKNRTTRSHSFSAAG